MTEKIEIPNPVSFILRTPLYEEFTWEGEHVWDVIALKYFKGTLDCYCPECGREATFRGVTPEPPNEHIRNRQLEMKLKKIGGTPSLPTLNSGAFEVLLQCTRNNQHHQSYIFLIKEKRGIEDGKLVVNHSVTKIGQHPSFADLNLAAIKKYRPVLSEQLMGELSRGIGLASHDVGVGAYVYLRRVFESLVEEAHRLAASQEGWSEDDYQKSRMAEKIKILRDHLPEFLVDNPGMYALLSKGLHELTERECLDHFDTLKIGIELILDEKLEAQEKDRKIRQAKTALGKAEKQLKDSNKVRL